MIFNDLAFLFIFLPVVVAGFYLMPRATWRLPWLILASAAFYGFSGLEHLLVLVMGVVWVFMLTRSEAIVGNRLLLALAVSGPMVGLLYYKYLGFIVDDLLMLDYAQESRNDGFALFQNVVLPAGISFFTFQMVAFAVDRYRGEIQVMPRLREMALYISFFPQLVAGPILRYRDVAGRIATLHRFRPWRSDIAEAISYICFGLAAKVLLADNLGVHVNRLASTPESLSTVESLYVLFGYSFEIYFDFYGYSVIAIGLGRLFGFRFPDNFKRPYESLNPRDFWRRWHVTLSFFIRDYLYLPIGGNTKYVRNILVVFGLCGLWHGAGLNFIVWGLYHGALVAGYHYSRRFWDDMPMVLQWGVTFTLVSLGWLLFLFDFNGAWKLLNSLAGGGVVSGTLGVGEKAWAVLLLSAVTCFFVNFEDMASREWNGVMARAHSVGLAGLFLVTLIFIGRSSDFIYFRF